MPGIDCRRRLRLSFQYWRYAFNRFTKRLGEKMATPPAGDGRLYGDPALAIGEMVPPLLQVSLLMLLVTPFDCRSRSAEDGTLSAADKSNASSTPTKTCASRPPRRGLRAMVMSITGVSSS